ncbi:MAG: GNAT family N-acetyltransferase [Devosiaceae bacterium]|nr:GNAT family N-acetyltransferase [Devosiaceae bacterium MH13]
MSLDAITVRPAEPADAPRITAVHDAAWRGAYRGLIPGVALERMVSRRGSAWWRRLIQHRRGLLVLDWRGTVAGYVTFGNNRSRSLRVRGEVYELYVDPSYQGMGFGGRLFRAAQARLADANMGHFVTWVLEDNDPAVAFYEAMGGEAVAHGAEWFDGVECRKLAFTWRGRLPKSRLG